MTTSLRETSFKKRPRNFPNKLDRQVLMRLSTTRFPHWELGASEWASDMGNRQGSGVATLG